MEFNLFPTPPKLTRLKYAFSEKKHGSLGNSEFTNRDERMLSFLNENDVSIDQVIAMNQVHGDTIRVVTAEDAGRIIPATEAAFCRAVRVTLAGSRIPWPSMEPNSMV